MLRSSLMVFLFLLAERIGHVYGSAGNFWTYRGTLGPDHWHLDYPHCGGIKQSPISIDTNQVVVDTARLRPFVFEGYDDVRDINVTLENNGHTVQVDLNQKLSTVSGGGMRGTYIAQQYHFHWGSVDSRGSEHDINGVHYPMEMHIVHYNNIYANISEAMDKPEGLAVLGFFFEVKRYNPHFENIIFNFDRIRYRNLHTEIKNIPLIDLIPSSLTSYYRYLGSLTTPPCYESVVWTLFNQTIEIAEEQLEQFRKAIFNNDESDGGVSMDISDDFRPPQCLFHRKVYASHEALKFNPNPVYQPEVRNQNVNDGSHGNRLKLTLSILFYCVITNFVL
uniref:Carbonic anhydrase n=1 Tax=Tridacna squamosa TaxID=80830 RepID=A0A3G8EYP0_TRISQ|nr:carbonic anhydrase 4-like protein [Tridacna squamosa]